MYLISIIKVAGALHLIRTINMDNKTKKNLLIALALITVVGFVAFRVFQTDNAENSDVSEQEGAALLREYSATNSYNRPGGSYTVTYTISVNADGEIQNVKGLDLNDPEHQVKVAEFSEKVTTIIKGKKLSDLEAIDKVGTSSLTTDSFNAALVEIKSQI